MGGSKTHTIKDIQIVGIMDNVGELRKRMFLEDARKIGGGMGLVMTSRGQNIAQLKGLYNEGYITAFGYNPNDSILIDKLDEDTVLAHTQAVLDSSATEVRNLEVALLDVVTQAILKLQTYPQWDALNRCFEYNGELYGYLTSVQNGQYIDITIYRNRDGTVTEYLDGKYGVGKWTILSQGSTVQNIDSQQVWVVEVEYSYTVIEDIEGTPTEVTYTEVVAEHVPIEIEYIQITDAEHTGMVDIVNNYNGDVTIYSCVSTNDFDGNILTTRCLHVTVSRTATYLGNGEYSVTTSANNPYNLFDWEYSAVGAAQSNATQQALVGIEQDIKASTQKVIWVYGDGVSSDNKYAYVVLSEYPEFIVPTQAKSMPIIPLKRNRSIVSSRNQDIMLKQIGIEGEDFASSLNAKEILDAYIHFGVPVKNTNIAAVKYIFELLAQLSNIRETIKFGGTRVVKKVSISYNGLDIQQTYGVDVEVVEDSTRPVGTYWYETETRTYTSTSTDENGNTETGTYTRGLPAYNKQESEGYYIKVVNTSLMFRYTVGGIRKSYPDLKAIFTQSADPEENLKLMRYPVVKDILIKLPINDYADIIEQSMCLVFNTKTSYKTKWYQRGFFKFIMIIVVIVVFIYTGFYMDMSTVAGVTNTVGVFGAGSTYAQVALVAGFVGGLAGLLGVDLGVLGKVLTVVALAYGVYHIATQGVNTFMQGVNAANTLLQIPVVVTSLTHTNGPLDDLQNRVAQQAQQLEEAEDEEEEMTGDSVSGGLLIMGSSIPVDSYYDMALGNLNQYNLMYEDPYDYSKYFKTA